MAKPKKTDFQLISDQPLIEGKSIEWDGLGFKEYADALGHAAWATPGPFTFGIFGEWGVGKTSLMRLIEDSLNTKHHEKVLTVWFNAWRYERADHPVVPLSGALIDALNRNEQFAGKLPDKGKKLKTAIRALASAFSGKVRFGLPGVAEVEGAFDAKDAIKREEELGAERLTELYTESFERLRESYRSENRKIVVFVDDLDRCLPDYALKLLESIKLVLAEPGFIFFLGIARSVIEGYLIKRYSEEFGVVDFDGSSYLDKMIQMPFHIPSHQPRMDGFSAAFLQSFDEDEQRLLRRILPIISATCRHNPRLLIRFLNNLIVDRSIKEDTSIECFAVTRALQIRWPKLFDKLVSDPALCRQVAACEDTEGIAELLNKTGDFRYDSTALDLLFSEPGKDWLKDANERTSAISFLQRRNLQVERHTYGSVEFEASVEKNFSGQTLDGHLLKGLNLSEVIFDGAKILNCDLSGTVLYRSSFRNTRLSNVDLRSAKMRYADLRGSILQNVDLEGAELTGVRVDDESWVKEYMLRTSKDFAERWRVKLIEGISTLMPVEASAVSRRRT